MKLLYLDDDPRLETAVRRLAKHGAYDVSFVSATSHFKAMVLSETPDLLLLDLGLGQESGIDVIHWLAQNGVKPPLVLLSGYGDALLDAARRIARASGIEVRGAFNKADLAQDLPPLLGPPPAIGPARPPPEDQIQARPARLTPGDLEEHIRAGRIEPFFQPIVSPADAVWRGAEVLARLRLPSGAILGATTIVPIAERAGLMQVFTEALFARVVDLKPWLAPLGLEFLSVNLSVQGIDGGRTLAAVRTLASGFADCFPITIELTETAAIADSLPARELAAQVRLQGISLAMDDFGSGYSSVQALAEVPFDTLKVDCAFVRAMVESAKARRLVNAILDLARTMGLRTIAEGVETDAQHRILAAFGADLLQGFLFGRPMDIDSFVSAGEASRSVHAGTLPPARPCHDRVSAI